MSAGRRLTIEQLDRAECCAAGRLKFLRRYGVWVEIDEDWAQLEWRRWKASDIWWLCRPASPGYDRVPLLSGWASQTFYRWLNRPQWPWSVPPQASVAAYFASIYADDGRITRGQIG